jgi:prepilin peptidase CpaA
LRRPRFSNAFIAEDILQTIITLVGIFLFIVAAYSDVKSFRIPNMLVAAVAFLGIIRLITIGDPNAAFHTIVASFVLLAVGFVLFWQGIVGGGDAKLITAAALLIGYHDLYSFLVFMSICGAVISIAALAARRKAKSKLYIPYGVAIATAGSVTLFFQSSFIG